MSEKQHHPVWRPNGSAALSDSNVMLAHGEGGRMMRRLVEQFILPALHGTTMGPETWASTMDDAARLPKCGAPLAITTDSYVVSPLFFPGGDIGSLAVYGTVNDLAVNGARPLYLTLSLILEEGLPLETLGKVLASVRRASQETDVRIVAGDTKVVPRGAADGLFINTAGFGARLEPEPPGPSALRVGDAILVSGPIGNHGMAVMCAREELDLQPPPQSDSQSLFALIDALRKEAGPMVRAMRDATRGGVAAVLHEWAEASGRTLTIDEEKIPVTPVVRGATELLGIDPIHVANEGTMVVAIDSSFEERAIATLRQFPAGSQAACIGHVQSRRSTAVTVQRLLGAERPLDEPFGAPLPRIC